MAQRASYSPASLHQENDKALEPPLRAVLPQVAMSLLVCCLDRLWVALGRVGRAMLGPTSRVGQAVLGRVQRPG